MRKQIIVNEEQLKNIINEVDVDGIMQAAKEYGETSEDGKEEFEEKLQDAMTDNAITEHEINEGLADYSLLFNILERVMDPSSIQFIRDSYEQMNSEGIIKTGEALLFVEYLLYIAGITTYWGKFKNISQFIKAIPKFGYHIAGGVAKRLKAGNTPGQIIDDFKRVFQNKEENSKENLAESNNLHIFASENFTKKEIYDAIKEHSSRTSTS